MGAIFEFYFAKHISNDEVAVSELKRQFKKLVRLSAHGVTPVRWLSAPGSNSSKKSPRALLTPKSDWLSCLVAMRFTSFACGPAGMHLGPGVAGSAVKESRGCGIDECCSLDSSMS
jgi:hypothetical protein